MKLKYLKLIPFLLALCFVACKKESATLSNSIIGTWELRISFGGQGGETHYQPRSGHYFKFADSTFVLYSNNILQNAGSYKIEQDNITWMGQTGNRIIFNNEENSIPTYVTISHDTLDLWINAYDAPSVIYKKVNDDSGFQGN